MQTEIKVEEKPLFQIKTAKKKHLEQIRDTTGYDRKIDFTGLEVLGYIEVWNSLLVRDTATGHYAVYNTSVYAGWLMETQNLDGSFAYRKAVEFPQLFLD